MDLKEFYEIMQISYLDSEVCATICKNEPDFKRRASRLKACAEKIVKSINEEGRIRTADMNELNRLVEAVHNKTKAMLFDDITYVSDKEFDEVRVKAEKAQEEFSWNQSDLINYVEEMFAKENEAQNAQPVEQPKPVEQPQVVAQPQPVPVQPAQQPQAAVQPQPAPAQPKPVPQDTTVGAFDAIIEKLDKARTFSNSDEYEDLTKLVKFANEHASWEKGENFTKKQSYVLLLRGIQSAITRYVKHKGEKGVKQNSYKKLAAVEELNADITKRLKEVEFDPFNYGKDTINKKDLVVTYEQEKQMYDINEFKRPGMKVPEPIEMGILEKHIEKLQSKGFYKKATAEELGNVDKCMCRIILSAMGNKEVKGSDVADLVDMRKEFWANPGKEIEKIKVEEPVNPIRKM